MWFHCRKPRQDLSYKVSISNCFWKLSMLWTSHQQRNYLQCRLKIHPHRRCWGGSLAVSDTDRSVRLVTGTTSAGGEQSRPPKSARDCSNLQILSRSAQKRPNARFRSNMSATLARFVVKFCQQGPTRTHSNFGPAWIQDATALGPSWTHLEQLRSRFT
jgi:hypothetical protein